MIKYYYNINTANKTKTVIQTKPIKLNILQEEINKNNMEIDILSKRERILLGEIRQLKDLMARAYILNDHYKDIIDLNKIKLDHHKIDDDLVLKKTIELDDILKTRL